MSKLVESFKDGVPFVNDITNPNLIDKHVFLIAYVVSHKNNSLYVKLDSENSNEILIENYNEKVPTNNIVCLIAKVLSSDTLDCVNTFTTDIESFELFDKIPQFMKVCKAKENEISKFI